MRRRRGDLRIPLCCVESSFGDGRIIVKVNEIVSDAGVARLTLEDRFQNRRALELVGIGLVIGEAATLSMMA
jgi:hypothetical protein